MEDYAKISSNNIRILLIKNKMSIRQLAEKIQIAPTTLNDSLKSKKGVSIDSLIKIAKFFNTTVNELCNINFLDENSSKTTQEQQLLEKYLLLDKHGKKLISLVIDEELERLINESSE